MDIKTAGILGILEAMRGKNGRRTIANIYRDIERELDYIVNEEVRKAVENERARVAAVNARPGLRDANSPAIVAAIAQGNKIQAIKLLRELTGEGLKDTKDEIERRLDYEPQKYGYYYRSEMPPQ